MKRKTTAKQADYKEMRQVHIAPVNDVPEPTREQIEIARGILRGYGLTVA